MLRRDVLRGLAGAIAAGCVRAGSPVAPSAMRSRFAPLMTIRVAYEDAHLLVPRASRITVPIAGGAFEGARLRGDVIPSSSFCTLARSDGILALDMRLSLDTDDGALILVAMTGVRTRSDAFRTIARFETASPACAYLNRVFAVGTATQSAGFQVHSLDELC